jgi:hypothetical protein
MGDGLAGALAPPGGARRGTSSLYIPWGPGRLNTIGKLKVITAAVRLKLVTYSQAGRTRLWPRTGGTLRARSLFAHSRASSRFESILNMFN